MSVSQHAVSISAQRPHPSHVRIPILLTATLTCATLTKAPPLNEPQVHNQCPTGLPAILCAVKVHHLSDES